MQLFCKLVQRFSSSNRDWTEEPKGSFKDCMVSCGLCEKVSWWRLLLSSYRLIICPLEVTVYLSCWFSAFIITVCKKRCFHLCLISCVSFPAYHHKGSVSIRCYTFFWLVVACLPSIGFLQFCTQCFRCYDQILLFLMLFCCRLQTFVRN